VHVSFDEYDGRRIGYNLRSLDEMFSVFGFDFESVLAVVCDVCAYV
jgi:hypothetical protein